MLAVAVAAQLFAVAIGVAPRPGRLGILRAPRSSSPLVVVLLFGALYPEPGSVDTEPRLERHHLQRVVEPLHAEDHDVGGADFRAAGDRVSGVDVLGVPAGASPPTAYQHLLAWRGGILTTIEPPTFRSSTVARFGRVASPSRRDGGVRSGDLGGHDRLGGAVGAHPRQRDHRSGLTDARALGISARPCSPDCGRCASLRIGCRRGLAQRGATAVIADLSDQVLRSVTALPPRQLAEVSGTMPPWWSPAASTACAPTSRPIYPRWCSRPSLTPATLAVIAVYDVTVGRHRRDYAAADSAVHGADWAGDTAARSEAALAATTTLQARLLDLVAGIPTLRALGRAGGSVRRIAELAAAYRRSTMATLRIAFLSALVLELLAALGVALVAVGVGLRLVYGEMSSDGRSDSAATRAGGLLATSAGRRRVPCGPGRKDRCR